MARKVGIRVDDVVGAAATVADEEGLEAVTLARVAAVLGVRSPSLYAHVDGVAGLRRVLALHTARQLGQAMAEAVGTHEGFEALRALAHAYRRFAVEHPGSYATILTTPSPEADEEVYATFADALAVVVGALDGLGVDPAETIPVIRGFRSALHGFVSLEASGGFGIPGDIDASFELLIELLVDGVQARAQAVS
jgi:AcrR family transcriptional regulator